MRPKIHEREETSSSFFLSNSRYQVDSQQCGKDLEHFLPGVHERMG